MRGDRVGRASSATAKREHTGPARANCRRKVRVRLRLVGRTKWPLAPAFLGERSGADAGGNCREQTHAVWSEPAQARSRHRQTFQSGSARRGREVLRRGGGREVGGN